MIGTMRLIMNDEHLETIAQIRGFLEGSNELEFRALAVEEKYNWIEEVLVRFRYQFWLKRAEKGVIRRYIERITGSGVPANRPIQPNRAVTM